MPFVMDYTDAAGVNYPESYWIIATNSQNHPGGTEALTFDGYRSVADYESGMGVIAQESFVINGPNYDSYIRLQFELLGTIFSYYTLLEQAVVGLFTFFSTATQLSNMRVLSLNVEATDSVADEEFENRVIAVISKPMTGVDVATGFTIRVNGTPATIVTVSSDFSTPIKLVYFDLAASILPTDVVTWEYDAATGFLIDYQLLAAPSFSAMPVVNNVGEYWRFNSASNSGQFAIHF